MSLSNNNLGYQYTSVSGGVGTTVVKDMGGVLYSVVVPGSYVGTINLHDSPTAAGTSSTSQIISLGLPNTNIPFALGLGVNFKKGLVYQATGTPVVTIVWS